jgi:hypothetical protein
VDHIRPNTVAFPPKQKVVKSAHSSIESVSYGHSAVNVDFYGIVEFKLTHSPPIASVWYRRHSQA